MKHLVAKAFSTLLFCTLLFLGIAPNLQGQPSCSNASLSGSFGYTNTGAILAGPDAGPFGGVGRQTFDGKGDTQATATVSVNGNIFHVTIKGTYVVNSDCTGSMVLTVSAGPETFTNHVDLVVVHGGAQFRAINTDPGSVITTDAKKQFPNPD
jgi:hypothetical protein